MARCNLTPERIPVDAIVIGKRHRAINPERVKALSESIKALGLRTPITVYDSETTDEDGCVTNAAFLVAGAHRLEALKLLGEEMADVIFIEPDPVDVKLWEIAENLHRSELTALERSEHIDEWRRLTVAKEQQGVTGSHPLGGRQPQEKGIQKTADALGVSDQTVRRAEKIASLPQETRDEARAEGWSQDRLLQEARKRTVIRDEPTVTKADGPDMYVEAHKLARKFSVAELQALVDHITDILKERMG